MTTTATTLPRRQLMAVALLQVLTVMLVSGVKMPPPDWLADAHEKHCSGAIKSFVVLVNDSGSPFDTFWVNPQGGDIMKIRDAVKHREVATYNSHVDSIMELHEIPDPETGECASKDQVCRQAYLKCDKRKTVVRLTPDFQVVPELSERKVEAYLKNEEIQFDVTIRNEYTTPVDLYFLPAITDANPNGDPMELMTLEIGDETKFNSYINNRFAAHETGDCEEDDSCKIVSFENDGERAVMVLNTDMEFVGADEESLGGEDPVMPPAIEKVPFDFHFLNDYTTPVTVSFLPLKGEPIKLATMQIDDESNFNSFVFDGFVIKETGACEEDKSCKKTSYTNDGLTAVVQINEDMHWVAAA